MTKTPAGEVKVGQTARPALFSVGTRVIGRCVTTYLEYSGIVAEVIGPCNFPGGYRYRLTDTGEVYSNRKPVEPIVDEATCRRACPDRGTCHHECGPETCFRVMNCGPLSGVFENDEWPADVAESFWEREYVW